MCCCCELHAVGNYTRQPPPSSSLVMQHCNLLHKERRERLQPSSYHAHRTTQHIPWGLHACQVKSIRTTTTHNRQTVRCLCTLQRGRFACFAQPVGFTHTYTHTHTEHSNAHKLPSLGGHTTPLPSNTHTYRHNTGLLLAKAEASAPPSPSL